MVIRIEPERTFIGSMCKCVNCGRSLKAVSIGWPNGPDSGKHFWAHR